MFTIEERALIFDASKQLPPGRIAYFTSLCPLKSGAILCGFQNGPAKHAPTSTVRFCRSADNGRSWTLLPTQLQTSYEGVPGSLAAAEIVEVQPGKLLMFATWYDRSDPARPLFDPVTEGVLHGKQLLCRSTDGGLTWSEWREIPLGDLKGTALTGPVLQWDDGTIGFAFESFKEYDDPNPGRHAAWLLISRDGGESFSEPVLVARHPDDQIYYWDQRLCPCRMPGEFYAFFWTHDLVQKRDLHVHFRHAAVVDERLFTDPIQATPIPGQISAPALLPDGRLLAFVVDRGRPGTMTLWCSSDGGATWPAADRLVVHTHDERAALTQGETQIDFKEYWDDMLKWSFGHPAMRLLGDGHLLLAWYAGGPTCMSIHSARIKPQ